MGNEYNMQIHHRRAFLPMLCSRPSIKDVALPRWEDNSTSISGDPLSPRVGCMGQVKRNNRVSGLPFTSHKVTIPSRTSSNNVKYLKLKKLFSGKNLTNNNSSSSTPTCMTSASSATKGKILVRACSRRNNDRKSCKPCDNGNGELVSVVDMDPPLPVIKKEPKAGNEGQEGDNLWKRRCRGAALKSLDVQQLQVSRHCSQQPTTV